MRILAAAAVVEVHHVLQRLEHAVVHVGRGVLELAQGRRHERALALLSPGDALVLDERAEIPLQAHVVGNALKVGVGDERLVILRIAEDIEILRHAEVVVLAVGEQRAVMAGDAAGFALEQLFAALGRGRHLSRVERRVARGQGFQELGNRVARAAVGGFPHPRVLEHLNVHRILLESLLHDPHVHVHDVVLGDHLPGDVVEIGPQAPVVQPDLLAGAVDEGGRVAEMAVAGIAGRQRVRMAEAILRNMTGGAGDRGVAGEALVEEQALAELRLRLVELDRGHRADIRGLGCRPEGDSQPRQRDEQTASHDGEYVH